MAVGTDIARSGPFIADGENRTFEYDFTSTSADEISVYCNGLEVTGTMSAITFGPDGGAVTFSYTPEAGDSIVILRNMPFRQLTVIENNTAFLPKIIETALDRLTMMCQQLKEICERAVVWPPGSKYEATASLEALLASAVQSANYVAATTKKFYADFDTSMAELNETAAASSAQLDEKNTEAQEVYNQVFAMLDSADILSKDSTIRLDSISYGDDVDAVDAAITQNKAKIAAVPKNLGGHTLTVVLNNQEIAEFDAQTDLAGRYDFDGFYNGVIQVGVSNTRGKISSNDHIRSLSFRNCHASIRFVNIDFTAAATDRIARVSPGAVLLVNCSGGAVFQGCSFFGKFRDSVGSGADPYDPYGYAIAAVDTPVYVPTIVKSSDTIDAEPMDTWGESINEDQYISAAYGSTELNDVTHLWNEESTRPGYIDGVLYYPKPEPEILIRRWNTNNQ